MFKIAVTSDRSYGFAKAIPLINRLFDYKISAFHNIQDEALSASLYQHVWSVVEPRSRLLPGDFQMLMK